MKSKPLIALTAINVFVGLFYGFAFYFGALWGVDDDADFSKVAWGHIAVRHFVDALQYAFWIALICLGLSWFFAYVVTQNPAQSGKWALCLGLLTLSLIAIGAAIGNIRFYIERPVGI